MTQQVDTADPVREGRGTGHDAREAGASGPPPEPAGSWLLPLAVLIVGMFMSVLDTSIVTVAMPVVQTDLGITASSGQWVSTAYSLTEGVMVPISAWLGYRFGAKRTYVLCMIGFTAASALCGLAAAMGLYGPGIVVDWRFIFFVNVPIGVLGAIAAVIVLREIPGRRDRPLDLLGFLTIAGGLFALLLALEEGSHWGWSSYPILILLAVASNLILLFVIIERQVEHPLIDLRISASRQFVMSLVLVSTFSVGLFAVAFYIPQFLQGPGRGLAPVDTGLVLVPRPWPSPCSCPSRDCSTTISARGGSPSPASP